MAEENKEPVEEQKEQPQEEPKEEAKSEETTGEEQAEQIDPEDLMAMWEDALKEAGQTESKEEAKEESGAQASVEVSPQPEPAQTQPAKLEELSPEKSEGPSPELDFILDIPLEVSVEIGRTKMLIKDLLKLNQGSIVELEKFAGEPVEVYVNGKLMAKGEVIVVNDKFGVRITEIISAHERVKKLGS